MLFCARIETAVVSARISLEPERVGGILCWSLRAPVVCYLASTRRVSVLVSVFQGLPDLASGQTPKALAAPSVSPWVSSRNPGKKLLLSNPDPLHPAKAFVSCATQNTIAVEGFGLPGMEQATMPPALGQPERRWTFRALLPNCVGLLLVRVILGITSPLGVGAFLKPIFLKRNTHSLSVFQKKKTNRHLGGGCPGLQGTRRLADDLRGGGFVRRWSLPAKR